MPVLSAIPKASASTGVRSCWCEGGRSSFRGRPCSQARSIASWVVGGGTTAAISVLLLTRRDTHSHTSPVFHTAVFEPDLPLKCAVCRLAQPCATVVGSAPTCGCPESTNNKAPRSPNVGAPAASQPGEARVAFFHDNRLTVSLFCPPGRQL